MTAAVPRYEFRTRKAVRVFDILDGFARRRGLTGAHPRPIGPVRIYLLADHTPGAERTFDPPPELVIGWDHEGNAISHGRLRTPGGGSRDGGFRGGPYTLSVRSSFYQRTDFDGVAIPATASQPEPCTMVLEAAHTYPFPVATTPPPVQLGTTPTVALTLLRGAAFAPDGTGLADVLVSAPGAVGYRTDVDGQWVLVFGEGVPAEATVDVTIAAPGTDPRTLTGVPVEPGGDATLAQTALRGRIRAPGVDVSLAAVRIDGFPASAGMRRDGAWGYYFPLDQTATGVTVTATLPDGRTRGVTGQPVTPNRTTIVPDFSFPRA
jgi:hypothetical protein